MTKVYVIHERLQYNAETKEFEPARDLSPAAEFGEMVPVVGTGRPSSDPNAELSLIQKRLADYTSDDYILPVGDPPFLMMAGAIAARATGGPVRWLRWDRRQCRYFASPLIDFYSDEEPEND